MRILIMIGWAIAVLLCAGGCSSSAQVSLARWQESVDDYIQKQANGDPNVLRDMTWKSSQKGFSIISADHPKLSTDANGILLAHRQLRGQPWFIFLVGLVKNGQVEDIRLAMLHVQANESQWQLGRPDAAALGAYIKYGDTLAAAPGPAQGEAAARTHLFPRLDDNFNLTAGDTQVTAVHAQSGARWTLDLPALP